MSSRLSTAIVTAVCGGFLAIACSGTITDDVYVGNVSPPGPLASPDAGVSVEVEAGVTEYCPIYECRDPFTTCPGSRFPCDVNILADPNNCGGCGIVCPEQANSVFACVEGKCVLTCLPGAEDCNGLLDDACEVELGSNANCNGCGDVCPDPEKPCIWDTQTESGRCGCEGGLALCGDQCVDTRVSDDHCGACGVRCPSTGEGGPCGEGPKPPNTYYGCLEKECGRLKCERGWADCDGNLCSNGCETDLTLPTSCGACGVVCDPGQTCLLNAASGLMECVCPHGLTRCGNACVDLRTDRDNCGGCSIRCGFGAFDSNVTSACSYGACTFACKQGWGDCNGDLSDACEVNLNSDPRNCGACGNSCNVGQPCILGQCAVEPCAPGEETR